MADIELVIRLPKEVYEEIMAHNRELREGGKSFYYYEGVIKNGTPLPKGHGDLVDRRKLINDGIDKGFCDWYDEIKYAEPIIAADKESKDKE